MTPEEKTEALSNLPHNLGYQVLIEELDSEVAFLEDKLAFSSTAEELKLLRLWQTTRNLRNILRDRPQEARQSVVAMADKPSDEFDPMRQFDEGLHKVQEYYKSKGIEWPPKTLPDMENL